MTNRNVAVILAAMVALSAVAGHAKQKLEIDPQGTYALVEIRNAADAGLGGTPIRGTLTITRFDPAEGRIRDVGTAANETVRVRFGRDPIAKNKKSALFLAKIVPDTWVIESSGSTSFSLGSMTFVARPGELIDLGYIDASPDLAEGEKAPTLNAGSVAKAIMGGILFRRPPVPRPLKLAIRPRTASDLAVPLVLLGRTVTSPTFSYGAKFPNYLGGLVNRIDGRDGRDRPNDALTVQQSPTPSPGTQQ